MTFLRPARVGTMAPGGRGAVGGRCNMGQVTCCFFFVFPIVLVEGFYSYSFYWCTAAAWGLVSALRCVALRICMFVMGKPVRHAARHTS